MQHVAVAVIFNRAGEVLVALRVGHRHQGGRWEFPGGKVEPGEDVRSALAREVREEVGLDIIDPRPMIRVHHTYPDKEVLLDVWRVDRYRGRPEGREGQPLEWVQAGALDRRRFPAANAAIITAAQLPAFYLITPEPGDSGSAVFLQRLDTLLAAGVRLLQLRAKSLSPAAYRTLAAAALERCRRHGARLLLNAPVDLVQSLGADGVHLSAARLRDLRHRPLPAGMLVGASCHDREEVAHAGRIGVDFIVVSPVLPTASHPQVRPLGWEGMRALTETAGVPVYALGGMGPEQLRQSWQHGGQGIAAIRGLWEAKDIAVEGITDSREQITDNR